MTNEMTAEEAVKILTYERDNDIFVTTEHRAKIHQALTMAIQALEAQSTDADCISRESVIRLVEQYPNIIGNRCSGLISDIKHLPSVTPQASEDDIHREREQAYMLGYEDASKKFRTEPSEDYISRNEIIRTINTMDRYVAEELTLCDTDKKYPKNEVFIVDDVIELIVENLPSVTPQYTDEEIDKAQAVEQAYVDKMVELAVEETKERYSDAIGKMKKAIDEMTEIHSDGEFYIKNVDAKWIISKYLCGAEMSGGAE